MLYSDNHIKVEFIMGVDQTLSKGDNVSKWNTEYQGEIRNLKDFNIVSEEAQVALDRFCNQIINSKQILIDPVTERPSVNCFIRDFKNWLQQNNQSFPVKEKEFSIRMLEWVFSDKNAMRHLTNLELGVANDPLRINFLKFQAISQGEPTFSYNEKYPIYEDWEQLVKDFNANAPTSLSPIFQSAGDTWCWMMTEKAFFTSAITGLALSMAFAFAVLILSTLNIIVAIIAVITIACVLCTVIGMIQIIGWRIGVSESLAMDFFVGFSVDYIVHVAMAYIDSIYDTRAERMNSAYRHIGLAVFSGAITTIISAVFLLFTSIYVLHKFGILIIMTILLSIFYSLTFMPAVFYLLGP